MQLQGDTCMTLRVNVSVNFAPWAPLLSHPSPSHNEKHIQGIGTMFGCECEFEMVARIIEQVGGND